VRRYLTGPPKQDLPDGVRLVHNFYPGPRDDPGRDRKYGLDGFRYRITDVLDSPWAGRRCYCGRLDGREHYGTVGYVDEHGVCWWVGDRVTP
jgi:hypothetical protein